MRKLYILPLILIGWCCTLSLFAQEFTYKGLNYRVLSETEKTAEVAINRNLYGDIVIPDSVEYNGLKYAVTSIGECAFGPYCEPTSVDLGNVKTIGKNGFYSCENLTSIDLKNVETIGDDAFECCSNLKTVDLKNVTTIGEAAFSYCYGLTSINLKNVQSLGPIVFAGCKRLKNVVLNEVKSIEKLCFMECDSLQYIDLGVATSIGKNAFKGCRRLTFIDLENITKIGDGAFSDCYSLKRLKAPAKLPTCGHNVFSLRTPVVYVPSKSKAEYLADDHWNMCDLYTFDVCRENELYKINSVSEKTAIYLASFDPVIGEKVIPATVNYRNQDFKVDSIGDFAFYRCQALTSIDFNKVRALGKSAFGVCDGLTTVDLKEVDLVGNFAFMGCENLAFVDFRGATNLGEMVFSGCESLLSVNLKNVKSVGYQVLLECNSLKKVYLPSTPPLNFDGYGINEQTVRLVPRGSLSKYNQNHRSRWIEYDFTDADMDYRILSDEVPTVVLECSSVASPKGAYVLPEVVSNKGKQYTITEIGASAFKNCAELTSFDCMKAKSVGQSALEGCGKLQTLILREVDSLRVGAFMSCFNLKNIFVSTAEPPVVESERVFEANIYLDATVYVPIGSKKAYESAPFWKNFFIEESDELTGIENLNDGMEQAACIYDLNGRLVKADATSTEGLQPGLYIMNGKKVMVK